MNSTASTSATPDARLEKELHVSVHTDFDACGLDRDAWDGLVASVGSDLYMSYDWCRVWWRHYAGRRQLRILVFRRGDRLVGIVPLVLDRLWLGPIPVRIAKFVGADSTIVVLIPAVVGSEAQAVFERVIALCLGELRCDGLSIGPLSGERPLAAPVRLACAALSDQVAILADGVCGAHTTITLPATLDEYLLSLSKSERGNFRRDHRNLTKDFLINFDFVDDDQVSGFRDFVRLHTDQWRAIGHQGHFADWPRAFEFNEDLVRALGPAGRVRLQRLNANGETIQMEYSLVFDQTVHWRLPARRVGEPWDRYGVGRVSRVMRFGAAIDAGFKRVEAGPGHYEYKLKLGGAEYPMTSILVASRRPISGLKTRLLRLCSGALNLLYYRIWFQRIAPRLPLPRRPLWKSWIRTRV